MEEVSRLYVLGCIASMFAPIQAVIEWSSRWLTVPFFPRFLIALLLALPVIAATFLATTLSIIAVATVFRDSWAGTVVSGFVAFQPWAFGFLTCREHGLFEFLVHYREVLILTAVIYAIESVYLVKDEGGRNPYVYDEEDL